MENMLLRGRTYKRKEITPEKCRERRQRRLKKILDSRVALSSVVVPEYGKAEVAAEKGRKLGDAVCVRTSLCCPEMAGFKLVHFFAVFDGHGGPHVSTLCKERLHTILKEELMRLAPAPVNNHSQIQTRARTRARALAQPQPRPWLDLNAVAVDNEEDEEENLLWKQAMKRAFKRMDDVARSTCSCGVSVAQGCACDKFSSALVGSTAVVAVVTPSKIIVANCGDSRAVLCRGGGHAVPLSDDQKPNRPDELARIEAAGGRVMNLDEARVQGVLSVSRAIGGIFLRSFVISEPEITITKRRPEDECLILASDGLWDVIPNSMACKIAFKALQGGTPTVDNPDDDSTGPHKEHCTRSDHVAGLLTSSALGKNSTDNISVIVVDLKSK